MVCLGNICRSPAAEAVLRKLVEERGLSSEVRVDSCGTGGGRENWYMDGVQSYHEGEEPDARMRAAAANRGIEYTGCARALRASDFTEFQYIVAMDDSNIEAIQEARQYWTVKQGDYRIVLLMDYALDESKRGRPVPDPYYGGSRGFENALDLIQGACEGLLDNVISEAQLRV